MVRGETKDISSTSQFVAYFPRIPTDIAVMDAKGNGRYALYLLGWLQLEEIPDSPATVDPRLTKWLDEIQVGAKKYKANLGC